MRRHGSSLRAAVLALMTMMAIAAQAADVLGLETLDDAVPSFAVLPAAGGAALSNADLRGKTVLLHFWATWCTPCKKELPALDALAANLDPARFAVVLVAIDSNITPAEVLSYARSLGVRLPVYVAGSGGVSDSFWGWGLPVSYLIDAQGGFIGRLRGPRAWNEPAVQTALAALQHP